MPDSGQAGGRQCVLLADRHAGLTEGLRVLLSPHFEAVIMVADEASLISVSDHLEPALAVMDLSLVRDGGLAWLERFRARCPGTKVVILTVHTADSVRRAVLAAGADALVSKRSIATDLVPTLRSLCGFSGHGRQSLTSGDESSALPRSSFPPV